MSAEPLYLTNPSSSSSYMSRHILAQSRPRTPHVGISDQGRERLLPSTLWSKEKGVGGESGACLLPAQHGCQGKFTRSLQTSFVTVQGAINHLTDRCTFQRGVLPHEVFP